MGEGKGENIVGRAREIEGGDVRRSRGTFDVPDPGLAHGKLLFATLGIQMDVFVSCWLEHRKDSACDMSEAACVLNHFIILFQK